MTAKVQGSFAAGFEPVKEALEKLLNSGCEDKVQLCVYVGKDCVLDLYGSFGQNDSTYNSDTIQVNSFDQCTRKILAVKLRREPI